MKEFIIKANECLRQDIKGFYYGHYHPGEYRYNGYIEEIIYILKNDEKQQDFYELKIAANRLANILMEDLPKVLAKINLDFPTVCVVPRAKKEDYYDENQKLFRKVVSLVVDYIGEIENGTKYITRHINTKTTHRKGDNGGDGKRPYPGITLDTCYIDDKVKGKDILLIDDLYTKTINIDEDIIQALLEKGATSVYFYSIGYTINRY